MLENLKNKIVDKITEQTQMPESDMKCTFHIEITDDNLISVTNCEEIVNYTEETVILRCKEKLITVKGFNIEIPVFSPLCTDIYGEFISVEFGGI